MTLKEKNIDNLTILTIGESYFKLPDDFNGSKFDAILLLAQYLYDHQNSAGEVGIATNTWEAFKNLHPWEEKKTTIACGLQHWDGDSWEFVD